MSAYRTFFDLRLLARVQAHENHRYQEAGVKLWPPILVIRLINNLVCRVILLTTIKLGRPNDRLITTIFCSISREDRPSNSIMTAWELIMKRYQPNYPLILTTEFCGYGYCKSPLRTPHQTSRLPRHLGSQVKRLCLCHRRSLGNCRLTSLLRQLGLFDECVG